MIRVQLGKEIQFCLRLHPDCGQTASVSPWANRSLVTYLIWSVRQVYALLNLYTFCNLMVSRSPGLTLAT